MNRYPWSGLTVWLLPFVALLVILSPSLVPAVEYGNPVLIDSGYSPQINDDGWVVWQGLDFASAPAAQLARLQRPEEAVKALPTLLVRAVPAAGRPSHRWAPRPRAVLEAEWLSRI